MAKPSSSEGLIEPLTGNVALGDETALVRGGAGVVLAWALYDYARTIFSYSILSVNFSLWVTEDHGAPVIVYTLASSVSLALIALLSPALGVWSDRVGRRMPFLVAVTALMVAPIALLALTDNLVLGLLLFVVANLGYQCTQVFYDPLLASVAPPAQRGRISGLGMALGYAGTISWGLFTLLYLARSIGKTHHSPQFLPTAIAVGLFALPCLLFVKERRAAAAPAGHRVTLTQTLHSIHFIRQEHPNLARFLLARLLYADAANTVVAFMAVYSVKVMDLTDREVNIFLPAAATFAVAGALLFGRLADSRGPKRMLNVILALWFVAMTWAALVPAGVVHLGPLTLPGKALFYAVGPLAGLALGGTRACDRTFLVRITPRAMLGEAFGLFSLVGDVASISGPLILGLVTYTFLLAGNEILGYRVAILAVVALLCVGWWLLQGAADTPTDVQPTVTPTSSPTPASRPS